MKKTEFLIVGQGLAGTILAFEMLRNNIDFRIVSSSVKSKASLVAAGMVNPLVFKRLTQSWLVDDLWPVMQKTYSELENILGERFYFKKDILKPLSEDEKLLWQKKQINPEIAKYIVSIDAISKVKPISKAAGYGRVTGSGYLNMNTFLNLAESYFRARNLIIDSTFNFNQINPADNSFEIENITTDKIVFCEGHHVTENPFFPFIKMNPTKGEVLLIHAPELSEEFILNKKVFVLPVGNRRFKVGSTYEWKDLTETTTENGKASIVERLDNLILSDYKIEEHHAGIRPTVSDRRPILGIHPEFKNISIFNGLGTKGVMLAPFFAKEMIRVLTIDNYFTQKEARLDRFLSDAKR